MRNAARPGAGRVSSIVAIEHRAMRRVGGFDERRLARDGDRLLDRADLEAQVEDEEALGADANGGALDRLEAGQRDLDAVRAGLDRRERVLALPIGEGRAGEVGVLVGDRDRRARHATAGITNRPAQPALKALAETGPGAGEHDHRQSDDEHDATQ